MTATRYNVVADGVDPEDVRYVTVTVEYRGRDLWAVVHHGQCLSSDGTWDYEPLNSDRTDEWLAQHRFDLERAVELARDQAVTIAEAWEARIRRMDKGTP